MSKVAPEAPEHLNASPERNRRNKQVKPPQPWQKFVLIMLCMASYLGDCLVGCKAHPEVPFLLSGVYHRGPLGFGTTVIFTLVIIYVLVKKNGETTEEMPTPLDATCRHCGRAMYSSSAQCPYCGEPPPRP
jgi:hypothetical protein